MSDRNSLDGDEIGREYERRIANASGGNPVFSYVAKEQMRAMGEQIMRTNTNMARISGTDQSIGVKAGFAAEEFHAETFNLDAVLKNDKVRAYTDKYSEFHEAGYKLNDTPDIVVMKDGATQAEAQLKYYKDAKTTATEMRQLNPDGTHKYEGMDLIGPSDQISPTGGRSSISDEAGKARLKNQETRPAVADAAKAVEEKTSAVLKHESVESTPLSKADAENIARNSDADIKTRIENQYKTASTIQQMKKAAVGAAAMSAVVSGSINTIRYLTLVNQGKLSTSDAVIKIVAETAASAADSAIKASVITGAHSMLIRTTGQVGVVPLAQQGLGLMLRGNTVTVAGLCAVDAVKDLVLLAKGGITTEIFYERQGKNIMNTSASVMGGSLGAVAFAAMGTSTILVPAIGGIVGALIAGGAMSFAIENGIETPYREISTNAKLMQDSARILDDISRDIFQGQMMFESFLNTDRVLDKYFNDAVATTMETMISMRSSINRI